MDLTGSGQPSALLCAMVAHALGFTRGAESAASVLAELDRAIGRAAGDGRRSRLEVRAGGGQMEIVIVSNREPVWRLSRSLA